MPSAVKLKEPPQFDVTVDYKNNKAWVYGVDNCFKLVGLSDEV